MQDQHREKEELLSLVSKLREEKDEAVAKVAQVNAEKDEAIAKLTAEKKETVVKLANEREAERKQFENVIAELNKDETLQNKRQLLENSYTTTTHPLDCDDPGIKFNNNVLTETTNSCRFSVSIHEEPEAFLDALMKDKTETEISKTLYQKVIQDERVRDSRVVVYWSFMVGKYKACDLLLRLLLEKKDENEIVIRAVSVDEEELETTILPNPHPHATKKFRLLLNAGAILLRPLPFGQTSFTFTARVQIGEGRKDLIVKAPSAGIMALKTGLNVTAVTGNKGISQKLGFSFEGAKADQLFFKIAAEFYERFQKEGVVDERYKRDFIENIDNAPALTVDEQRLIGETMKLFEEASSKAKRVAGTANEPVEKFLYHSENGGAAWAMTVTKVDLSAESLFAELWLLDTYARKAESKGIKIRQVWNNLDGTRGLQFTTSVGLPGGFQDRLFETWMTWEELIDEEGRRTFIIAIAPLETIPTWVVDKKIPLALTAVQEAIEEFRQDEKVDAAELREKATFMRERGQDEVYSEEENALLERVRQKFEFKETLEYLSTMRKKFDKSLEIDEGRRAEIVEKIKQEEEAGEVEALAQVEALFEDKQGWERPPRIFGSADSKVQVAAVGGKAWCKTSVKIRTEIEEVAAFLWSFGSRANMEISGDVERTFEEDEEGRLVPLEDFTAEDGQALGNDLLWKAEHSKKRVERLKEVVEKSRTLQELNLKYPWMKAMLATALEGNIHMNRAMGTKLICVSEKEAMQIGKNLVSSLMTEQLAEAGVNEWRVQNPAVKELMEEQAWLCERYAQLRFRHESH
ncbi:hypothetical protein TrLO_g210 [Triparma laevis f. longispina]|uniref:Uncharacterized protein n=1 Tax=Triparma laevis f. longispina TaxID=1714387 RepID=A0A9W6ZK86_9STRA|nr:hypothetical protein TrLO_g210 [Triparma laevis f. longispina]